MFEASRGLSVQAVHRQRAKQYQGIVARNERLLVCAVALTAVASACIAWLFDIGSLDAGALETGRSATSMVRFGLFGRVLVETFAILLPVAIVGALAARKLLRRWVVPLAIGTMFAIPTLMTLDGICLHWIGQHLMSARLARAIGELGPALLGHITEVMIWAAAVLIGAIAVGWAFLGWLSLRLADVWRKHPGWPKPRVAWFSMALLVVAMFFMGPLGGPMPSTGPTSARLLTPFATLRGQVEDGSAWSVVSNPSGNASRISRQESYADGDPPILELRERERQQRQLALQRPRATAKASQLPDVVIVVVESFRRELLTDEVMPNLSALASRGLVGRNHFSGGNATSHGMFSLLNGLEAVWYERPIRYSPLANRLFHQARYELGFFAGHNDWTKFRMDGYISSEHFDVFEASAPNRLESDRRAVAQAADFLARRDVTARGMNVPYQRKPRLALLYLYATHATYLSYNADRVFSPAADDRFLYPYTRESRDRVWNRYRNSARTIDRFLRHVIRDDRVVLVTGDHGESFLEDDTIGHGVRISEFQNTTPAVIYVPGRRPRVIEHPTSHADLLPTLLAALELSVSNKNVLDGTDLWAASELILRQRSIITRDYLSDEVALIGPWTGSQQPPFAYRFRFSWPEATVQNLVPIDRSGRALNEDTLTDSAAGTQALLEWRRSRFGIRAPATAAHAQAAQTQAAQTQAAQTQAAQTQAAQSSN